MNDNEIYFEDEKKYLRLKLGHFYHQLYICEGLMTMMTVWSYWGHPVVSLQPEEILHTHFLWTLGANTFKFFSRDP